MKKLMIAAAAAAMIGGVQAYTANYNFVAYLTTTAGQQGQDVYTPGAAYVGRDATGAMWYDDLELTTNSYVTSGAQRQWTPVGYELYGTYLEWTTAKSYAGVEIPCLVIKESAKEATTGVYVINDKAAKLLTDLGAKYKYQSLGVWCDWWQWYTKTDKVCFRVVGADTINTTVTLDSDTCCINPPKTSRGFYNAGNLAIAFSDTNIRNLSSGEWINGLMNCFGAQTYANAQYIETYARVTNVNTALWTRSFEGWLAGQGYSFTRDNVRIPYQIAGNIVGSTTAPKCVDCCTRYDQLPGAVAFECLNSAAADATLRTACFGTFYIQYVP